MAHALRLLFLLLPAESGMGGPNGAAPGIFQARQTIREDREANGIRYTWNERESLAELSQPARVAEIKRKHATEMETERRASGGQRLYQILGTVLDDEDDDQPCLVCHL